MADYACVGSRIVAIIIDQIILAIVSFIIALPFGIWAWMFSFMGDATSPFAPRGTFFASLTVLNVLLWIVYFTYFEGTSGQTLGKKIMSIKVIKENGDQPTFSDALIRTILRIIDGIAFYLVGLIVILVSEKKQRIGDMAAGTIVVKA
ncbi:MAG TPA: RDD family protein [Methanophagales archaeon]|nr:RDD family protein [Methanophagales archaeon]